MLSLITATLTFWGSPKIDLSSGAKATLIGKGPPVVFSTGLFGSMPTFLYSDLFKDLKKNVTIVSIDRPFISTETLEEVCEALGVNEVGFMAHSSFDSRVLTSPRLRCAVLCDPIVLPHVTGFGFQSNPFQSPSIDVAGPVLDIRAERSYNADAIQIPIPVYLAPEPVDGSKWSVMTMFGIGHADLLDDRWADLGANLIPWINGPIPPVRDFNTWTIENSKRMDVQYIRKEYRKHVATLAAKHLLGDFI
jgi:hypothetical protein